MYPPLFDLVKYWYYKYLKKCFFSKNGIDKKLLKYLDYNNGFYVELGANNGFSQSNTLFFEIKRGWKGVLIEPSPNLYLQCCYFRDQTINSIFCNACVGFDYPQKYVDMTYGNLMTTSDSLPLDLPADKSFFEKRHMHISSFEEKLQFGAVACTLDSILHKSNAPQTIDLLSLDVEGAEIAVLSGINFEEYKFRYILVESRSPERLKSFLSERSYKFVENLSDHDLLFCLINH